MLPNSCAFRSIKKKKKNAAAAYTRDEARALSSSSSSDNNGEHTILYTYRFLYVKIIRFVDIIIIIITNIPTMLLGPVRVNTVLFLYITRIGFYAPDRRWYLIIISNERI